jgi:hypothetical protein
VGDSDAYDYGGGLASTQTRLVAILVAIRSKTVGRRRTDPLSSEEIQGAAK